MNAKLKTQTKKFLKQTFFVGLLFSTGAFAFIRLMISPLPIEIAEDVIIFIKTVLTGWLLVMIGKGAFEGLVFILELGHKVFQSYMQSIVEKAKDYSTTNFISEHAAKANSKRSIGEVRFFSKISGTTNTVVLAED